jgi:cytochrome c
MNRQKWFVAGISVTVSLAIPFTISWFIEQLNPVVYPSGLAYEPVEDMPPRIDLASVQRGWPNSLGEPGERERLIGYQHDIKGQAPMAVDASGGAEAPEAPPDLGTLLVSADVDAGKSKARACVSCHNFTSDGPNRIGPSLWGIVGSDIASKSGFTYSSAMQSQPGDWTYEQLFNYLASPARSMPGTKMSFAGLRRPEDRAAVIKYLATLGGSPPPEPQPKLETEPPAGIAR